MTFSPPPDGSPALAVLDDGPAAGETLTPDTPRVDHN